MKKQIVFLPMLIAIFLVPGFAVGQSVLGDVDQNGDIDFSDIAPFIALLASSTYQFEADVDGNGNVDFFDIQPFIDILADPPENKFFQSAFSPNYPRYPCGSLVRIQLYPFSRAAAIFEASANSLPRHSWVA